MKCSTSPEASSSSAMVVVGLAPLRPFAGILNACGHADEDDAAQGQVGSECHMQADPRTKRIAEQGACLIADLGPHRLRHQTRCRRQVGPHRPRIAVSRQIHRDQRVRLGEELPEGAPEASRLGEAVEDDQRRPGTAHVDMEWHAR